jgi:hypothetical protein
MSGKEISDIIGNAFGCLVFVVIAALVGATVVGYQIGSHNHDPKYAIQP